jgi:hypothetical protein
MKGAFYFIRPLLISVVQVLTMVVLHDLLRYLCKTMGYKSHFDIAWGISLQLGILIFAGVVLLANYLALANPVYRTILQYEIDPNHDINGGGHDAHNIRSCARLLG